MRFKPSFVVLTVLVSAIVLAFCILPVSFADDSWTQAWMDALFPHEPPPDDLINLPENLEDLQPGVGEQIYDPGKQERYGQIPPGGWQPPEPWYHGWAPLQK